MIYQIITNNFSKNLMGFGIGMPIAEADLQIKIVIVRNIRIHVSSKDG